MGADEVNDGSEVLDGLKAAGLALGVLDNAVEGFSGSVGDAGPEVGDHAVALLAYQFDSRRAHLDEGEAGVDGEHSDRARLMLLQALWERDPFFVHRTFLLFQSAR